MHKLSSIRLRDKILSNAYHVRNVCEDLSNQWLWLDDNRIIQKMRCMWDEKSRDLRSQLQSTHEEKKTKKTRAERARLYIVKKSKSNQFIVITKKNMKITQRIVSRSWTLVKTKKKKMKRASISLIRKMIDNVNQVKTIAFMKSSSNFFS
jgi:hypothetical protein